VLAYNAMQQTSLLVI